MTLLVGLFARALAAPADVPLVPWTSPAWPDGVDFGATNGISAGDYNQDGWVDAIAWSNRTLWQNVDGADWVADDLSGISRYPAGPSWYGASFADYDRDGYPELATEPRDGLCVELLDNVGGTSWVNASDALGSTPTCGWAETLAWADVDGDGWLDLFVPMYPPHGNVFFRSLGRGDDGQVRFRDATADAGVQIPESLYPEGVQFADSDDDGDVDLYSNAVLYQNVSDGAVQFDRLGELESGIGMGTDEGAAFGDYDLDGDLDLYVAYTSYDSDVAHTYDYDPRENGLVVWRNTGDGRFEEATDAADAEGTRIDLGLSIEDWDADGDLDLTTQFLFWRNDLVETGVAHYRLASHDLAPQDISHATPAWVDFDRDGDLDTVLGNYEANGTLYENTTYTHSTPPTEIRTVRVRVLSDDPDRPDGLETEFGAIAELLVHDDPTGRRYRRFVASGSGYLNQNEYTLTFALPAGLVDPVFDVSVDFPSRPVDGAWRVDATVNPMLGGLRLADLSDREIRVFRSGIARVDSVDSAPDPLETPRLRSAGGGLPGPRFGLPLDLPLDAPADTWVGLAFHTTDTTRLREVLVDGVPAVPATCGSEGNVLLWDTTDGVPRRQAVHTVLGREHNDRHSVAVDDLLAPNLDFRIVVKVSRLRANPMSGPLVNGTVAAHGGFHLVDVDPCSGLAAAAAVPDPTVQYATVRYSASDAIPANGGATTPDGSDTSQPSAQGGGESMGCGCGASGSGSRAPILAAALVLVARASRWGRSSVRAGQRPADGRRDPRGQIHREELVLCPTGGLGHGPRLLLAGEQLLHLTCGAGPLADIAKEHRDPAVPSRVHIDLGPDVESLEVLGEMPLDPLLHRQVVLRPVLQIAGRREHVPEHRAEGLLPGRSGDPFLVPVHADDPPLPIEHEERVAHRLERLAELVERRALVVDVGVDPDPPENPARFVSKGDDPGEEPAEHAVVAAERELHLERLTGSDRAAPPLEDGGEHQRIVDGLPSPTGHLLGTCTGVLVPARVVVGDRTVRVGEPRELRHPLYHRPKLKLAFGSPGARLRERDLRALSRGDVLPEHDHEIA